MQFSSRSAAIAAELRDEILRGQYRSGERLPSERDLAERFGVHRSAIREALKRLEQLGLADIRPGGARVAPLDEASLDVVGHLLDLEDPPNPRLVDQVLEVMSGLFTMSARLCAERANDEQRRGLFEALEKLENPDLDSSEQIVLIQELGDRMAEATDNMVLKLVRRGIRAHVMDRLSRSQLEISTPVWLRVPHIRRLTKTIRDRDGTAASEAAYELTKAVRRYTLETLEAEHDARSAKRNTS